MNRRTITLIGIYANLANGAVNLVLQPTRFFWIGMILAGVAALMLEVSLYMQDCHGS